MDAFLSGWGGAGGRGSAEKNVVFFLMAHVLSPSVEGVFGQDWHLLKRRGVEWETDKQVRF